MTPQVNVIGNMLRGSRAICLRVKGADTFSEPAAFYEIVMPSLPLLYAVR
jgi:hypothetical protein